MTRTIALLLALGLGLSAPAAAQTQQAGTAVDTDAAFQALIEQCDDVDALMLRARIRLQLPRTTPEAAETAQRMLDEGFATCGGGDLEAAKTTLAEALKIAEAGTEVTQGAPALTAAAEAAETAGPAAEEAEDKPWWQLW